jgi:germacradienol/geosmin synthase
VGLDLPHCASMIHADATPAQLDLSSDWLAWGTYGDDWFPVVFGTRGDVAGAKAVHDRLALFMPLDGGAEADGDGDGDGAADVPEPANPLERGLDDLWRRTAGPLSASGRARFRTAIEDMTSSWVWEIGNQAANRIPDPVDYIEMRRRTFGSGMTMSLARLAHDDVVDPALYDTSVVRELETAAQDYACFTNDLFSYQKEVEFEGEVHNIVLVVERFLDVDRLAARDVVADLMAERMRQFEQLADVDLPALGDALDLDESTRSALARHADGLKEWMSGILEWHRRCVRYTEPELVRLRSQALGAAPLLRVTGLGTSAARFPLTRSSAGA